MRCEPVTNATAASVGEMAIVVKIETMMIAMDKKYLYIMYACLFVSQYLFTYVRMHTYTHVNIY